MEPISFDYKTSQECWRRLNKYLAMNENKLAERQGIKKFGTQLIMLDAFVNIDKAWVDPEFNFGRMFGYKVQKWTHLVRNYVDLNYLDLVRNDILSRERKRNKNYSVSFHFSNKHNNGKDCLISVIFSRRNGHDRPILTYHSRATELTKRFLIDLLLLQRIGEYIYGEEADFSLNLMLPYCYITAEAFSMFHTYRPIPDFMAKVKEKGTFQNKILSTLEKYQSVDPLTIGYKSNRRAAYQLQTHEDGQDVRRTPALLASTLYLDTRTRITYPENVITERQRREHLKSLNIMR
jgi:hypothetical protein